MHLGSGPMKHDVAASFRASLLPMHGERRCVLRIVGKDAGATRSVGNSPTLRVYTTDLRLNLLSCGAAVRQIASKFTNPQIIWLSLRGLISLFEHSVELLNPFRFSIWQ